MSKLIEFQRLLGHNFPELSKLFDTTDGRLELDNLLELIDYKTEEEIDEDSYSCGFENGFDDGFGAGYQSAMEDGGPTLASNEDVIH